MEIVVISGSIVEPLIAASIVFVAVESLMTTSLNKWRPMIIFGVRPVAWLGCLGPWGFPVCPRAIHPCADRFNIGVEVGQLTVVAVAAILLTLPFGRFDWYRRAIAMPASIFIALVGAYWFIGVFSCGNNRKGRVGGYQTCDYPNAPIEIRRRGSGHWGDIPKRPPVGASA